MKTLILAGGGHAQLAVLQKLARQPATGLKVSLLTPSPWQFYSGMLPGWMQGHYTLSDCRIDLRPLAQRAGVKLIHDRLTGIQASQRKLSLASGNSLSYDLLSLDLGSEMNTQALESLGAILLPAKPLAEFAARWNDYAQSPNAHPHLAIVGGGAAGVELALAARHALSKQKKNASITLITGNSGLLPGHHRRVQALALRALQAAGIDLHFQRAHAEGATLKLADGQSLPADLVIAANGAVPPPCLHNTDLRLGHGGFLAVSAAHQSLSHPDVFAAGDMCVRSDTPMARSGVHAVRAGPVLAHNLIATLAGRSLKHYRPRTHSLYLLATGQHRAIASWGPFSAEGHWVWRWKDDIDRGFVRKHCPVC